jgi:two-component system response regulator FixJ|uniref:response regulator transcription factor n=1 Tax=uncultured Sphingomonas sp. TaxID=158754 RepID=UPI0035CB9E6E
MRIYIIKEGDRSWNILDGLSQATGQETETFTNLDAFLAATAEDAYGCVLLAVEAPGQSALDLLAHCAARTPVWPVVILSGRADVDDAIAAFRHGALHFLHEPYSETELALVLREAVTIASERLAEHRRIASAVPIRLSQRERQVLGALAQGRQSKVIAWHLGVSVRTIDMHRSNILTKLGARNASQAVSIALDLKLLDSA